MDIFRRWLIPVAISLVLATATRGADATAEETTPADAPPASAPAETTIDGVPVVAWGRTLVEYRLPLEFSDVQHRARATGDRVEQALGQITEEAIVIQQVQIGQGRGVVLTAGTRFLLSIMEGDLDPASDAPIEVVAENVATEIRELVRDHASQHSVSLMIRATVQAAIATILFVVLWTAAVLLKSRLLRRLSKGGLEAVKGMQFFGYELRPIVIGLAHTLTRIIVFTAILTAAYVWITFVLSRYPYTHRWADQLGGHLINAVGNLASAAVHQIPNLLAVIVIFLVTRVVVRITNGWFLAIESGKHFTVWLDPEAARATRRLANIGIWVVALIVAYPHLPGSHSEAFRGISVFLGLMLSLGGAGFVGQIIGGLAAVYSRAVKTGDFIIVGNTEGVVKDVGVLSTKLITRTREEVTIPNSMLIGSAIRNLSRGGKNATVLTTGVTIGYDTPWRQVENMLLQAAAQTEGLVKDPEPRVLQTVLDDFYVRYELNASAETPYVRAEALARLHGNIQDVFNEQGVQIMSPHFRNQLSAPVIVPKDRWFTGTTKEETPPPA